MTEPADAAEAAEMGGQREESIMTLDIESVLAGHVLITTGQPRSPSSWNRACSCDEPMPWDMERATPAHRAHVAAVLREQIAAWLVDEGKREMHERGGHWHTVTASDVHVARKLDALAAQVAPSRVPGEGS